LELQLWKEQPVAQTEGEYFVIMTALSLRFTAMRFEWLNDENIALF
jgi:hypothetical protein